MIDYGHIVMLGPLLVEETSEMLRWRNDYSTWRWCRQSSVISLGEHQDWFFNLSRDNKTKMFSIHARDGGHVGVCGLTSIDWINRRAEFSLYIGPEYRKKGYAKGALKTLISHGFQNLNLNSIWGESFIGNPAIKMFEEIGFKKDGVRREFYFRDGKYIDAFLFSILRNEWTKEVQR